ncbi:MAG: hypothetical protein HY016_09025 [Nitrosomonadales bacterium]|nr:hypothetical protein [Nitrosomonadales bacterium]
MEQGLVDHGMLNHLRLAMTSYDLKLVLGGIARMLESFSREVSNGQLQADDAAYVACRIANMQNITGNMLDNLNDIEGSLAQAYPAVGQLGEILRSVERTDASLVERPSHGAGREKLMSDLSDLPPHIWYM